MWKELEILRKDYLDLKLSHVIDYEKFSMISIVYNSTKIEGCSLTESDTKVLLENNITAKGKPLSDHLMVKDHFAAFQFIKKQSELKLDLSIPFIKNIAAHVMKNTGGEMSTISGEFDTSKGDLRLAQVYVDQKYFPDFKKVEGLLKKLVENINTRLKTVSGNQVLELAADAHYNLVNIHPFGDGNGRTSRLIMNYIQMYHNEPLIKIFTEDRVEYIDALNLTEENEDISVFREFIGKQQIKYYKLEIEKYKKRDLGFLFL